MKTINQMIANMKDSEGLLTDGTQIVGIALGESNTKWLLEPGEMPQGFVSKDGQLVRTKRVLHQLPIFETTVDTMYEDFFRYCNAHRLKDPVCFVAKSAGNKLVTDMKALSAAFQNNPQWVVKEPKTTPTVEKDMVELAARLSEPKPLTHTTAQMTGFSQMGDDGMEVPVVLSEQAMEDLFKAGALATTFKNGDVLPKLKSAPAIEDTEAEIIRLYEELMARRARDLAQEQRVEQLVTKPTNQLESHLGHIFNSFHVPRWVR